MPLTWLVTGCSSGFGAAFVPAIVRRGDNCIASGRSADTRLAHLKSTGAAILDLDVTNTQQIIDEQIKKAIEIYGGIDVLVNNAGYMMSGFVEEMTPEKMNKQFSTNLYGAMAVTRAVLPHMRAKQHGTLVFMGSQSGWRGDPSIGAYAASKYALEGVAESLSAEVTGFGIRTILFCPGVFATNAFSTSYKHTPTLLPEYNGLDVGTKAFVDNTHGHEPGDPKKAVEIMLDVVRGEGVAKGKEIPFRLPLGSDGMQVMQTKCRDTLRVCEEWEVVIKSTDIRGENGIEMRDA